VWRDEGEKAMQLARGQSMVEYALVFVFVVTVVIILLTFFSPELTEMYSNVIENI